MDTTNDSYDDETEFQECNALLMLYTAGKPIPCILINTAMGLEPTRVGRLHYALYEFRSSGLVRYSGKLSNGCDVMEESLYGNTYEITPAGIDWVVSHLDHIAKVIGSKTTEEERT